MERSQRRARRPIRETVSVSKTKVAPEASPDDVIEVIEDVTLKPAMEAPQRRSPRDWEGRPDRTAQWHQCLPSRSSTISADATGNSDDQIKALLRRALAPSPRGHIAAARGLPPGLSKEKVQEIYRKYQWMKAQGTPQTDPEMIKARQVLQTIQQNSEMTRRQQAQRLKQQQNGNMGAQAQMNGASNDQQHNNTPVDMFRSLKMAPNYESPRPVRRHTNEAESSREKLHRVGK